MTVVSDTSSIVEIAAAETTVDFTESYAVTSITPTSIIIEITEGTTSNDQTLTYTVTINGTPETVTGTTDFVTAFTFPETTLSLSFPERQSAFIFTGSATTEVIIPPEHTHVTVNGVETAIDLPGLTTTLTVTDSTNVIVQLPAVSTEMTITEETFDFTWKTYSMVSDDSSTACGAYTLTDAAASSDDFCVPGLTTTIVLPSGAAQTQIFLHAPGLTTEFTLPGITTTFLIEPSRRTTEYLRESCILFHTKVMFDLSDWKQKLEGCIGSQPSDAEF